MKEGFDFSTALYLLRHGSRLRRVGWNGKGMWIALEEPQRGQVRYIPPVPQFKMSYTPEEMAKPVEIETVTVLPYVAMKTADGGWVPWTVSQPDILAQDWEEVT